MTPEGRRRKAKAIRSRVLLARDNLEIALADLGNLRTEMGLELPSHRSTCEALRATRVAAAQLDPLVTWLSRK